MIHRFTTPEVNQGVTETDGTNQVTKTYDHKYRIRDFFKPALSEVMFYGAELMVSVPACAAFTPHNWKAGMIVAAIPQALTYIGFRLYELIKPKSYITELLQRQKVPSPYKRILEERKETIENLVNE